jgi:hypothetical protein
MSYWLLSGGGIHGGDIRPDFQGRPWSYHKIYSDDRLRPGDVVYCSFREGLYAWGYVMKKEAYQDEQLGEVLRVDVTRPEIRYDLLNSLRPCHTRASKGSDMSPIGILDSSVARSKPVPGWMMKSP